MGLKDEITAESDRIFKGSWTKRDGQSVPDPGKVGLESNDGVEFANATVLYADMAGSTQMVDGRKPEFAAEVYRAYLAAAAKVIRSEAGEPTAYDGDRVMAVFLGDYQSNNAVRCALKINWAVKHLVSPALQAVYKNSAPNYIIQHRVGIDRSPMLVARTGVRGGNDLVWVGRAANYAAKLAAVPDEGYYTFITKRVYDLLHEQQKIGGNPKRSMWEERSMAEFSETTVYRSSWHWSFE